MPKPSVAIIGTRDPDADQIKAAETVAYKLSWHYDCTIHTGAAAGIDHAAMRACRRGNLYVYLPWKGYNRDLIPEHAIVEIYDPRAHKDWTASLVLHPASHKLANGPRSLHARNYGICAGRDLVLAFPRSDGGGGTAQGIRIANKYEAPVIVRPSFEEFSLDELMLQVLSASRIVPF
jgi:DNA recombination-mediator protein A